MALSGTAKIAQLLKEVDENDGFGLVAAVDKALKALEADWVVMRGDSGFFPRRSA